MLGGVFSLLLLVVALQSCSAQTDSDCGDSENAGVPCSTLRCQDSDIRLVGGDSSEQGRLEVCFNETWGTVCDDHFDLDNANVACRQLNFTNYNAYIYTDNRYGAGSGPIFVDNLQCTGTEQRLVDCSFDSNTVDCDHTEDVGIWCNTGFVCSEGDVRLVGGSNSLEGGVEVCLWNSWGTVCDDSWDVQDSAVVCDQLGHSLTGSTAYSLAHFGQGSTLAIHMDNVDCTGSESRLIDCVYDEHTEDCSHNEDAGVRCNPVPSAPTIGAITRTSATAFTLSWEPLSPEQSQGLITSYYVSYRPIERERLNTRDTDDLSLVQSTMDTQITIDDLDPRREYAVSVAASTSAGRGKYGIEQIVGWFDHRKFQLHLMNSAVDCQQWLLDGTSEKISGIVISFENLCNCEVSAQYITDIRLVCSEDTDGSIVFQGRMIDTPEHDGTYLLENLQKWVVTEPTVVTKGIQLKVQLCRVEVRDFRNLDCIPLDSTPTVITSSKMPEITPSNDKTVSSPFPVAAVAASVGGVFIILIVIVIVFAILVVRRKNHKQRVVRIETPNNTPTNGHILAAKVTEAESNFLSYYDDLTNDHIYETINEKEVELPPPSFLTVVPNVAYTTASTPQPIYVNEEKGEEQDGTVDDTKEGENPPQIKVLEMAENDDYVEMRSA